VVVDVTERARIMCNFSVAQDNPTFRDRATRWLRYDRAMSAPAAVHRDIDVPLTPDEVWSLVADGVGWVEWLVEEADIVVEPGADGTVVDGGERRRVHVDEVVPGVRVTWSWWPVGRPADTTSVELVVLPATDRTVVRITETRATADRWELRAALLASGRVLARAA
jgi:hypothetical protein